MTLRRLGKEVGVPVVALVFFFCVEAAFDVSEWLLTALLFTCTAVLFRVRYHPREATLFMLGTVLGVLIEIGLRILGYQQVWAHASLAGVPVWLPFSWGFGAVVFTRIGYAVRRL